ncbi:heparin lyase I family protein [Candidatus Woesearchaeota archaeon]|nr:heparin lyase I family protein [Candidatus Woesearchaeota archaeon]
MKKATIIITSIIAILLLIFIKDIYISNYVDFPRYNKGNAAIDSASEPEINALRDYPVSWEYDFENGWNAEYTRCSWAQRSEGAKKWRFAQMQTERAGEVITDPMNRENHVMKFVWQKDEGKECDSNTQKKASLFGEFRNKTKNQEFWSFSVYFPSEGMEKDSEPEIIIQWHDVPDEGCGYPSCEYPRNPPLTLENKNDELLITWIYDARKYTPPGFKNWDRKSVSLGTTPKNTWITFEFHIRWDPFGNGLLEVWQDGVKVVEQRNIPLGFNDDLVPYIGIGIYQYTSDSDYQERIIYFDDIKQAIID